ncbi:MAG: aldehyde ferredoxin oxidoreductase N-terminal domain-containing protein, partial [Desulfobacteraceae bacterium]
RTSVCGMSPDTFPSSEFSRGNLGGRFGTMMKLAGWDGIVIQGSSDKPVWINIINDQIKIEDARYLWGLDTWQTQTRIVSMVGGRTRFGEEWQQIGDEYTTTRPEILCIGPVGETKSRLAALITGSGVSARIGGHAAVFGAKNLKAISVTGTGKVHVSDPESILKTRIHHMQSGRRFAPRPGAASCSPCINGDRRRGNYYGGETMCACFGWLGDKSQNDADRAAEALIKSGLSSWSAHWHKYTTEIKGAPSFFPEKFPTDTGLGWYLQYLYEQGFMGPGKQIDSAPLPMDQMGELSFREAFIDAVIRRVGIGDALAEGACRAAERWGRLETDMNSGALRLPAWGATCHWTMPYVEWAYAYMLGAGDPLWHGFMWPLRTPPKGKSQEKMLEMLSKKTIPYTDDIFMFNYAWKGEEAWKTGIYSHHKAKQVAWARQYAAFWNESMSFCELIAPELEGESPEIELAYYKCVTGKKDSFVDTMLTAQKIITLERAIRVMHGRSRDKENFFPYMYMTGASGFAKYGGIPIYEKGKWRSDPASDMYLDRKGVEDFKTHYYTIEGWDKERGWPTKKSMEKLGLNRMIKTLKDNGKLGKA